MTDTWFYRVSATHTVPKYAADRVLVKVTQYHGKFSATARGWGAGHEYSTPDAAARDMFLANDCRRIVVELVDDQDAAYAEWWAR